jgi:hypothetical protein
MKFRFYFFIAMMLLSVAFRTTFAVVGCRGRADAMAPYAELIFQGVILKVSEMNAGKCDLDFADWQLCYEKPKLLESGKILSDSSADYKGCSMVFNYPRCGNVWHIVFQVEKEVVGKSPSMIDVYAANWIINMQCDDLPNDIRTLKGRHAFLFIENYRGKYWTINGTHSLLTYEGTEYPETTTVEIKRALGR